MTKRLLILPAASCDDVQAWVDTLPANLAVALAPDITALSAMFSLSPYLLRLAEAEAEWLATTISQDADEIFAAELVRIRALENDPVDDLIQPLRQAKARIALYAGTCELGGLWSTQRATEVMSEFADCVLQTSLNAIVAAAARADKITIPEGQRAADHCGLVIFALGKHGGAELNFSSDIDIVAFYDPEGVQLTDPDEAGKFYTRLIRQFSTLIEERTAAGYVFRVDLRLRPDPSATPVALAMGSALTYYESRGQNWERAAWIKARSVAGDIALGDNFLKELAPFIWRKHLDFAAIADIQAIKRQINLARAVGEARVAGHNVKLGRGGIREIEFFAQTQQLIAGGRNPDLRVRTTSLALESLAQAGWIDETSRAELAAAYWYLRAVENRLQMRRDEQTHTMPEAMADIALIAAMMDAADVAQFSQNYLAAIAVVTKHYADLFASSDSLAGDAGNLVFTGSDDDPGTLETLSTFGFDAPDKASAIIRKWHYGSYPATRAAAARAHLTALLPDLLRIIAQAGNADEALYRFDEFLSRLPTGVQFFALLKAHESLCRLLVALMASAPRLSEAVIRRVHIMDGLIGPSFSQGLRSATALSERVDGFLSDANSYEDLIDRARLVGKEQQFLISAGLISGTIDVERAGDRFAVLAELLVTRLFAVVRAEFENRHGKLPGSRVALLAFGKMASREMTATSDLDFILLYDTPASVDESDGEKPLAPAHYYARLTQRLITAISAPTAAGILYETDMRLRPSGQKGPLATPVSGFASYQQNEAWTWEHLALTRTRVLFGDNGLDDELTQLIATTIAAPRDGQKTLDEVISMRARMAADRKPRGNFDLKLASGGLIDIEFMAQSAQLILSERLGLSASTIPETLQRLGEAGFLENADRVIEIHKTYSHVLQVMSTCLLNPFDETSWTAAFRDLLAGLTNYPDFDRLKNDIEEMKIEIGQLADQYYILVRQSLDK